MKDTIKDLKERRSIKKYRDRQIEEADLQEILKAGMNAPTGMGMQSPVMVVIQDKETISKLSKMNAKFLGNESIDPFYGAPTVIVVLADKNRSTYVEDGSLVMGNLMNAAHALGIASCCLRPYDEFGHGAAERTQAGGKYQKGLDPGRLCRRVRQYDPYCGIQRVSGPGSGRYRSGRWHGHCLGHLGYGGGRNGNYA